MRAFSLFACLSFLLVVVACSHATEPPALSKVGDTCKSARECASGVCLLPTPPTTGVCTSLCDRDRDCASATVCEQGVCLRPCKSAIECAPGISCVSSGVRRVCGPVDGTTPVDSCSYNVPGSCRTPDLTECTERASTGALDVSADKKACEGTEGALWSDGPCPIIDMLGGCRTGCSSSTTTWYYRGGHFATPAQVESECRASGKTFVKAFGS